MSRRREVREDDHAANSTDRRREQSKAGEATRLLHLEHRLIDDVDNPASSNSSWSALLTLVEELVLCVYAVAGLSLSPPKG
jgi:hypothetical protein